MTLSVTSAPFQSVDMPALDLRRFLTAIVPTEGIRQAGEHQVQQRGAGANMSVDLTSGYALVEGDAVAGQGLYLAYNDATYNLTGFSAAHATLPRVDRVAIRVRDNFHDSSGFNDIAYVIVTGTATSGANLTNLTGAAAVPSSHLLLANVLIPATATTITTANIANVADEAGAGGGSPAGTIISSARSDVPIGWLACDGAAVSRTVYARLFAAITTSFGAGDGSTTFNVPNLRGRVIVDRDPAQTEFDALGEVGGAKVHTLTLAELAAHAHSITDVQHGHSASQAAHNHYVNSITRGVTDPTNDSWQSNADGPSGGIYTSTVQPTITVVNAFSGITATNSNGSGAAHNNLQPYIALNHLIKT